MLFRIDWLSWTLKRTVGEGDTERSVAAQAWDNLCDIFPYAHEALAAGFDWSWQPGRTPYRASMRRSDGGLSIFVHPTLDHVLFELTGTGCEALRETPVAWEFLDAIKSRLTRLDVAADILTDLDPRIFGIDRDTKRFRSHSEFVSESGITYYVGSRQSNRYARVYRYNPPHERSHLLRVEHVLKAEDAEATAQSILDNGIREATAALGRAFGWKNDVWDVEGDESVVLKAWRPERHKGKTLYWLADTVAPLLVKLHRENQIDAERWFAENVLSKLDR